MVDQHAPHEARCQSEKMTAILQCNVGLNQAQEGFVHNTSRFQGMIPSLAPMEVPSQRRRFSYTSGVNRSSACGWPDRHSVSSCVKLAGTCIIAHSPLRQNLPVGRGFSPKHTLSRHHEGIPDLLSLLPMRALVPRWAALVKHTHGVSI